MYAQIYVGEHLVLMTDESLRKLFEEFGDVVFSPVVKDRETDRSPRFCFVEMADPTVPRNAINRLMASDVMGNLKVTNHVRKK
jgi:RNA recognition motif-containing protein